MSFSSTRHSRGHDQVSRNRVTLDDRVIIPIYLAYSRTLLICLATTRQPYHIAEKRRRPGVARGYLSSKVPARLDGPSRLAVTPTRFTSSHPG